MSFLKIEGVSKKFDKTPVLKDINLQIEKGSFVTLLGPSGCGKTTLLRIIAGLETSDTGKVSSARTLFFDHDHSKFEPPQKRKLGFVFQDYALWPHMTVEENIAFPLKMAKWQTNDIRLRVAEVLETVQLSAHSKKRPNQLSGGQKQRVSIGRAIASKPELILLDEPLSNLDANLREELGAEIRALTKELKLTCINVTHDRREAQQLSDQVALMKDGVIHQLGTPEELFRKPVDHWAASFVDAGNILPAQLIDNEKRGFAMIPRNSIAIGDTGQFEATVKQALFYGDRYELSMDFEGVDVIAYLDRALLPGAAIKMNIRKDDVYWIQ